MLLFPELELAGAVEFKLVIVLDVEVVGAELNVEVTEVVVSEKGAVKFVAPNTVDELVAVDDVVVLDPVVIVVLRELDGDDIGEDMPRSDCVELDGVVPPDVELIEEEPEERVDTAVVEVDTLVVDGIAVVVEEIGQVPPGTFRTCPNISLSQSRPGLATFSESALTVNFLAIL